MQRLTRFLLMSLLAVAACAGITTNAIVAPGANLSRYQTYGWAAQPAGQAQTIGEQQVRAALERDLAQKGLTPATNGSPDFLVAFHAKQQQRIEATPGYGWGYGWGGFPDVTTYTEGTLIVDFIDPKTNQVFWRGTASAVLNNPNNPDPQKIDKAVSKLVQQYPTQMASTSRPAG
jgi:hypothetical protein